MLMFALGFFGFLHELILADAERPYFIGGSLTLMGAAGVLRFDERWRKKNGGGDA